MDTSNLVPKIIEHEGVVKHLYCDHLGNVTCGVGFLVRKRGDVLRFKWDNEATALADFARVSAAFKPKSNRTARYYAKLTTARLLDVETPLREMLWSFMVQLETRGLPLNTFPVCVQEAVLDMAYNVGVGGLLSKFPKFVAALRAGDWAAAARECGRPQVSAARNVWTRKQLRAAL